MSAVRIVSCVILLISTTLANVEFTSPTIGSIIKAGDVVTAHWRDSDTSPRISELLQYNLYLCVGGETAGSYEDVALLIKDAVFARGNSVSFRIDANAGGDNGNAYYLKMVASGPEASVLTYSDRFTLTSMSGESSSPITSSKIYPLTNSTDFSVIENDGHEKLRKRQVEGAYTIPYHLQTGPTRYAPMAKKPGSTIPARSPTPQFPASAYTIATTYLPPATVQVTLSASLTYSVASVENTENTKLNVLAIPKASPAPHSQDAQMKRFLERWKD
ncbi:beta-1,6-glucan biosynthesis protein [Aspergillus ellipticus CBS 707.79]|uniref:Beta-1,6-glucan biosynthesis protein n=1 Tax=Aspergillus ellipticus CBS 707.79 TaxID=1448320 RepID=A0A319DDD9_9EURO|nr:beta-1,6-glucan biosynthesis protein [Aspergillus ellipticus CBS 707.79]